MSIVMILVGLLIGGILGAQARSIISQITGYNAAVNTFQLKYGGMPGDLTNASTIVSGATTNGNGDGLIGWMTGNFGYAGPATPASGASYSNNSQYVLNTTLNSVDISYEYSAFWQHLTADQLISGKYTLTNTTLAVNTNMPYTKTNKNIGILAYANSGDNFNYYQLGVTNITLNTVCPITQNFLSPADAFLIDSKIDDGLPASGIVAARGINSNVTLLTIDFAASYTGSATISSSLTNACVVGTSYAASTAYNTAASVSSQLCQLRIKMN
jgi:hypothetical protein